MERYLYRDYTNRAEPRSLWKGEFHSFVMRIFAKSDFKEKKVPKEDEAKTFREYLNALDPSDDDVRSAGARARGVVDMIHHGNYQRSNRDVVKHTAGEWILAGLTSDMVNYVAKKLRLIERQWIRDPVKVAVSEDEDNEQRWEYAWKQTDEEIRRDRNKMRKRQRDRDPDYIDSDLPAHTKHKRRSERPATRAQTRWEQGRRPAPPPG